MEVEVENIAIATDVDEEIESKERDHKEAVLFASESLFCKEVPSSNACCKVVGAEVKVTRSPRTCINRSRYRRDTERDGIARREIRIRKEIRDCLIRS
jgi:hypothetical protein